MPSAVAPPVHGLGDPARNRHRHLLMSPVGFFLEFCNSVLEVGTAIAVIGSFDGTKDPNHHRRGDGDVRQRAHHRITEPDDEAGGGI